MGDKRLRVSARRNGLKSVGPSLTYQIGIVQYFTHINGHPFVTALVPGSGEMIRAPVLEIGGGGKDVTFRMPCAAPFTKVGESKADRVIADATDPDTAQVILMRDNQHSGGAVAVGFLPHPKALRDNILMDGDSEAEKVAPGEQGERRSTVYDVVLQNRGAQIQMTHDGSMQLDTDSDDSRTGDVRIQLKAGGVLRLARGGSASGRVLLAGPTVEYLGTLEARLKAVESHLTAVKSAAGTEGQNATAHKAWLDEASKAEAASESLASSTIKISSDATTA